MKKQCHTCHKFKDQTEYDFNKSARDKLQYDCKVCRKLSIKERGRTKEGLLFKIYRAQVCSSKKRKHPPPEYTRDEFRDWGLSHDDFHTLFEAWVVAGYCTRDIPSADRLDDYTHYRLDNLRWVTWQVNNDKGHSDVVAGINLKQAKTIYQLTLEGAFVAQFYSCREASRQTGIPQSNISLCCSGDRATAAGYLWVYPDE